MKEALENLLRKLGRGHSGTTENAALLSAIHQAAKNDNPKHRRQLYSEILKSNLIMPTPEIPDTMVGTHKADGSTSIQLVVLNNDAGVPVTPVFTDPEALRNWDPNTPSIGLSAKVFFELVVPLPIQQILINPFDTRRKMIRPGGFVTRPEFELLARGVLPTNTNSPRQINLPEGTRLQFSQDPANALSDGIKEDLVRVLSGLSEIESAFDVTVTHGEEQPHGAIAFRANARLDDTRTQFIAQSLLQIVRPNLKKDEMFDVIPLSSKLHEDVVKICSAFYNRPKR